jgi:hypothetical protein
MEWKQKVGRSVLVVVALGYATFFAAHLMKPHANSGRAEKQGTAPVFVATTPATARLPEIQDPSVPTAFEEGTVAPAAPVETVTSGESEKENINAIEGDRRKSELALDRTTPNANKFRNKRSNSINDGLGMDILKAADETIADVSLPRKEISESMLKSLGISKHQYALIKMREKRLAQKLRAADERGSDGFARILKTDHVDWMKEYLGPIRYQRFMELAGT